MAELRDQLQATLGDRYVLEQELGGGGMSRVFVAHESALGRKVVVKVLPSEMAAEVSIDRFRREIQLAAQLQHPHIVPLLAAGETNGLPFFTMPYVRGESLRARLAKEGELPVSESVRILREVALALGYAHENGVVHRDIKPENILISGGSAVVTDFGVAKAVSASSGSGMTSSGIALGTPAYMAPEQATADPNIDHRADIYALGVIAYEMLTGSTPFAGRSPQATLAAQVTETPDAISHRRATVPPMLASLIMSCLEKRPADRPRSAQDVMHQLDALTTPSGGLQPTMKLRGYAKPSGARRKMLIMAAVAVLAIVVFAATRMAGTSSTRAPKSEVPIIVVIPFENIGKPEGREFTDGMTEEITSRLSAVSGLKVIGRQTAKSYAGTTKTMKQIAAELGVNYLLTGTVRWDRGNDGKEIVRVSPALVKASDATQVWGQAYQTVLSGIFAVQSKVASEVTSALNVALLTPERSLLLAKPTNNVEAYGFYLRGAELLRSSTRPREVRDAIEALEKAVALDPQFGPAYAQLSIGHTQLYWTYNDPSQDRRKKAKTAADKALSLGPSLPEGHLALGIFHYHADFDFDEALKEFSIVERMRPNDVDALYWKAVIQRRQGKWLEAVANMKRAIEIEPRMGVYMVDLAGTYRVLREYDEAERVADRAIVVTTDDRGVVSRALEHKSAIAVGRDGHVAKAAQLARQRFAAQPRREFAAWEVLQTGWPATSDPELRRAALEVQWTPEMGEKSRFYANKMAIHSAFANIPRARAYSESTIVALKAAPQTRPNEALNYAILARAHAILGNRTEALAALDKASALMPLSQDALAGSNILGQRAITLVVLGDHDAAVAQLEELLKIPSLVSKHSLRLHPVFDPLRGNARFLRLVGGPEARSQREDAIRVVASSLTTAVINRTRGASVATSV